MVTHGVATIPTDRLVGCSPAIQRLRRQVARLARYDVNLLLVGESGTGKELVSRIVHSLSPRSAGPFLGVNCAAIHESLLESELFGHEAGAFTGARAATLGFLRAADGGTILLDEVGDMSESLQRKLLRVLEQREVVPVGDTRAVPFDARVISATNCNLGEAVRAGRFRADLYYRLNVVTVSIPPLRERRQDIEPLAEYMLKAMADMLEMSVKRLSEQAKRSMLDYDWPGNVRELGNVIQRAYVLSRGRTIGPEDLGDELLAGAAATQAGFPTLNEVIRDHVGRALRSAHGVRTSAARLLGIDRKRLWRMMNRYAITP